MDRIEVTHAYYRILMQSMICYSVLAVLYSETSSGTYFVSDIWRGKFTIWHFFIIIILLLFGRQNKPKVYLYQQNLLRSETEVVRRAKQ